MRALLLQGAAHDAHQAPLEKHRPRAELTRDALRPASRMTGDETPEECVKAGVHDLPVALHVGVRAVLSGGIR